MAKHQPSCDSQLVKSPGFNSYGRFLIRVWYDSAAFTGDGLMKNFLIAVFVICATLGIAYGQQGQKKSAHDSTEWKAVADQFMSELVGNRIEIGRASCRERVEM